MLKPFSIEGGHKLVLEESYTTISYIQNWLPIYSNFAKIFINKNKVCDVKMHLTFGKKYELNVKSIPNQSLIKYILILILIIKTSYDPE